MLRHDPIIQMRRHRSIVEWCECQAICEYCYRSAPKTEAARHRWATDDLKVPPGNRLELLKGKRIGQHSIRVNDQWRVCFRWTNAGAEDVEIVDYH